MSDQMIETWVRYTHLDKLYGYLPGMAEAVPAVYGMDAAEYEAVRSRFAERAEAAARSLLADPTFAAAVDTVPFSVGQTVLAVGDSITDDLQSWAEILAHLLRLRRPELGVRVVDQGLSAHTTATVLRRWPATVAAIRPDWVLCALGGNDVPPVGPEPNIAQVSPRDSIANLRRMHALCADARWVWFTPVPVVEERVAQFPAFRFGGSTWRNDDIRALADAILDFDGTVVDLVALFGMPADPVLQGPDGVHVTLEGQTAIARALVERLSASAAKPEPGRGRW
jgi:lysophospholipase L1-like esterase